MNVLIDTESRARLRAAAQFGRKNGRFPTLVHSLRSVTCFGSKPDGRARIWACGQPEELEFGFVWEKLTVEGQCDTCGMKLYLNPGTLTYPCWHCPDEENRGTVQVADAEPRWRQYMNGGIIYHGPHDGFGSGAAPTFAVCLTPTDGWSVHT